jgi:hypothetical protein
MPIATAELAIGDIRQAMRLLLTDDLSNQPVFYGAKIDLVREISEEVWG